MKGWCFSWWSAETFSWLASRPNMVALWNVKHDYSILLDPEPPVSVVSALLR